METKTNQTSFMAVHPGSVLKDELDERQITQKAFAKQLGMQPSHLNEIIKGTRSISTDVAYKLEQLLGIPAIIWSNLQTQYNHDLKVLASRSQEEQEATLTLAEYDKIIDTKTLCKALEITTQSPFRKLQQLQSKLDLPPVNDLQQAVNGAFRKSATVGKDTRMILTWTLLAKYHANQVETKGTYNENNNKALVNELFHIFHENTDVLSRLTDTLSRYGIVFIVEDKINHASIDAYSFRLDDNRPAIAVTLRYKRIDNLAFTLMHELAHIINNDMTHLPLSDYDTNSAIERRANEFATDALIPNELWNKAPAVRMNPRSIQKQYIQWAEENHLNKWIVLGRISYEMHLYQFKNDNSRNIL